MTVRNDRNRAFALEQGRDIYLVEVTDTWPACVHCGAPLRRVMPAPDARSGLWRSCNCPGIGWQSTANGWRRYVLDEELT